MIDPFAASYVAGETPVPCVNCNMSIKFKDLLVDRARSRRPRAGDRALCGEPAAAGRRPRALPRPRCRARPELFPVRHHARAARLPALSARRHDQGGDARAGARASGSQVADKHDSQDICFVPTGRYTDVIERLRPGAAEAGDIVDLDGRVLGRHDGIIHFTVGQRRGLGVAAGHPLYVIRLDAATRRVIVGPREALRRSRMQLREVNWIGDEALDRGAGRRSPRGVRQGPLDAAAAAGLAAPFRRRRRGRIGRRRGRDFARPGLRLLRCAGRPVAGSGRRIHPECGRSGTIPARCEASPAVSGTSPP